VAPLCPVPFCSHCNAYSSVWLTVCCAHILLHCRGFGAATLRLVPSAMISFGAFLMFGDLLMIHCMFYMLGTHCAAFHYTAGVLGLQSYAWCPLPDLLCACCQ
jgi:hypothetical protein